MLLSNYQPDQSGRDIDGGRDEYDDIKQLAENLPASLRQKVLMGKNTSFGDENNHMGNGDDDDDDDEDDDDDDDDDDDVGIRGLKGSREGWGKKKNYYAGDTADLEIGQDVQDAYDEEEAALGLQKERLESMQESDYLDDVHDEDTADTDCGKDASQGKKRRMSKDTVIGSLESIVLDEVSFANILLFSIFVYFF